MQPKTAILPNSAKEVRELNSRKTLCGNVMTPQIPQKYQLWTPLIHQASFQIHKEAPWIFLMRMWSGERDRGKRENHISNYFWDRIYFFKSLNKIWKYMWIKHKLSNWSFLKNISSLAKLPFWAKIQESKNPIPKKRYPKN